MISVVVGTTTYSTDKIFNLYFKYKLNQLGRFEFDAIELTDADQALLIKGAELSIYVNDTKRFDGYIEKVVYDEKRYRWHFDGLSMGGLLTKRSTRTPVTVRAGVNYTSLTAKQLVQQCLFRFGGFATTDWSLVGGEGEDLFMYKLESRTILDHICNLAKVSGYDWRIYRTE